MSHPKFNASHIFIDFDGTLVDTLGGLFDSYSQFMKIHGLQPTQEEFDSLNGPSIPEIIEIFKNKYRLPGTSADLLGSYLKIIEVNYGVNVKPFSDSEFFLSSLHRKNKTLILVTSSREHMVLPLIKKFKWDRYFTHFIWAESVEKAKPHPDIYLRALELSKAAKNKSVVIEDSVHGVAAAKSADLPVLGLSLAASSEALLKAGATKTFKSLTEIFDALN